MFQSEGIKIKSKNTQTHSFIKRKTPKFQRHNDLSEKLMKILNANSAEIDYRELSSKHKSLSKQRKGSKKLTGKISPLKKSEISKAFRKSIKKLKFPYNKLPSSSESPHYIKQASKADTSISSRTLLRLPHSPDLPHSPSAKVPQSGHHKNRFQKYDLLNIKNLANSSKHFNKLIHENAKQVIQTDRESEILKGSNDTREDFHSKFGIDSIKKDVIKSFLLCRKAEEQKDR